MIGLEAIAAQVEADAKRITKRREHILWTISDLVSDLMYYSRKEDEDLPASAIEQAVAAGEITVEEIIAAFADGLRAVRSLQDAERAAKEKK